MPLWKIPGKVREFYKDWRVATLSNPGLHGKLSIKTYFVFDIFVQYTMVETQALT